MQVQPEPLFDLDGSEIGHAWLGDNFSLIVSPDGIIDLETESGLTLDDLAQLKATLDRVLGGATGGAK